MSDDKPKIEAVEDEPEGMPPYSVVLQVFMVGGDISDDVQEELTNKMTLIMDEMREKYPNRVFTATITDFVMGMEARGI